jgi:DNA repair protein RecO (recombination protein O)
MKKITIKAIVIRNVKYLEHDCILTLMTDSLGKVSVMAKGAQSMKCKYLASTMIFSRSEFTLSKSNTEMYYVSSVKLLSSNFELTEDYARMTEASYILEATDIATRDNSSEGPGVYNLLSYSLKLLRHSATESFGLLICLQFVLKLLGLNGTAPNLTTNCMRCGQSKEHFHLSFDEGGTVCLSCAHESELTAMQVTYLRGLLYLDLTAIGTIALLDVPSQLHLLEIINRYLCYAFDKRVKSFNILKER